MPGASSRHVSQKGDQNQNIRGFSPFTTDRKLTRAPVAASNNSMSGTSSEIAVAGDGAVVVVAGASVVVTKASVVVVVAGAAVVVTGGAVVAVVVVVAATVVVVEGAVVAADTSEVAAIVVVVVAGVVDVVSGPVVPDVVAAVSDVVATVGAVSGAAPGLSGAGPVSMVVPATVVEVVVAEPVVSPPHDVTTAPSSTMAKTDGISRKSAPGTWGVKAVPGYPASYEWWTTRFRGRGNRAST